MMLIHPVFLAVSAITAAAFYITVKGRKAKSFLFGMIPLFLMLSFINPLFNTYGDRVLFTWWERPALHAGGTCVRNKPCCDGSDHSFLWFASYSFVMTSDKFLYLFGKAAPSVSLVLTMILRLLPNYEKRSRRSAMQEKASACPQRMEPQRKSRAWTDHRIRDDLLGSGRRHHHGRQYAQPWVWYREKNDIFPVRFEKRDKILLAIMAGFLAIVIFCCIMGGSSAQYTPEFLVAMSPYTVVGAVAYGAFLALPTAVNITEEIIWHILRSKI